ncbi:MAG: hypothetical protein BGO77_02165 [Caedibacter sp. 37-49]|nr:MAG: hypothetical protein BGO77_02165 [Caedibacter sp. 37-49]
MSALHSWIIWFFTALFFAYQFIVRVFSGLCVSEIMYKFHIDATEFGLLSSMYYYGYAGMQIPMAVLLDRFGPKFIVSLCCFICSLAIFLFYWAENWYLILLARLLIGASSAAGFLGTFKVISLWFPFSTYAKMFGLTNTVGLLGAVYGGKPVSQLITLYGWENVLLIIGGAGLIISVLILIVTKPYNPLSFQENHSFVKSFRSLFSIPILFLMALGNLLMVGPLEGFADVWGVPYLMEVCSFEKADASFITSSIFTGMIVGGPILAYLSEKFKISYQITGFCGILMAALFSIMFIFHDNLSYMALATIMFLIGILCCYQVLIFSIGASIVSPEIRNIAIAFLNSINMLGGVFFHTAIGSLMDIFWTGKVLKDQRVYEATSYECAVWIIPIAAFMGGILFLLFKPPLLNPPSQNISLLHNA